MNQKIILTEKGYADLKKELDQLLNIERPKVIEELKEARAQGDLSENADYDAARNRQAEVEAKIKDIENNLEHAEVIKEIDHSGNEVKLGSEVTFRSLKTKEEYTFTILGAIESNPFENTLSNESPVAKALMGAKVNDILEIRDIPEPYKVKVLKIY